MDACRRCCGLVIVEHDYEAKCLVTRCLICSARTFPPFVEYPWRIQTQPEMCPSCDGPRTDRLVLCRSCREAERRGVRP